MTHPRQSVRDAVVALLAAAGTAAGSNVKASWRWPQAVAELPSIIVRTTADDPYDEEGDRGHADLSGRGIRREITLQIEARVADATTPEEDLDDLAREIEQAIEADPYELGTGAALLEQLFYVSTDISATDAEQDPPGFVAVLTYTAVLVDDWS